MRNSRRVAQRVYSSSQEFLFSLQLDTVGYHVKIGDT